MTVISGDGVFSHACVGASDLAKSTAFYDVVLAPLGVKNLGSFGDSCVLYGKDKPALLVLRPGNGEPPSGNGVTIGFAAASPADVDAFHAAGLRRRQR
jgi:catechol 2,3-dioxygenase-like lactoylglutathione lyase family enzyme